MAKASPVYKITFFAVTLLLVGGCPEKIVNITSEPTGASILLNGMFAGETPIREYKLSFANVSEWEAMARMEDYENGMITIRQKPLDQKDYNIVLERAETVKVELVSFEPQLTEAGIKLVIIKKPTLAYLETIERSPNAKSVTKVTNNEDPNYQIADAVLSPTEDMLVYQVYVEEGDDFSYSNIWKTVIGSFGKTRVTYGKWRDFSPCFGPNGKFFVFSSNRTSPQSTLWRIRVDGGGGITNITNTLSEDYSPSVSPDGNFISYTSNPPDVEEPQIWTIGINGNLPTQLREGENPQISPDGDKILFFRKDKISGRKQIWFMNSDGGQETQLTQNVDYDATNPKWSPDGAWIVYDANEGLDSKKRPNYDIWMMTANGSKKTQLTTNGSLDNSPCWDMTGKFIYFRSNRGGALNIWRFEPVMP